MATKNNVTNETENRRMRSPIWPVESTRYGEQDLHDFHTKAVPLCIDFLKNEGLGEELFEQIADVYLPLSLWLANQHQQTPIVIGISGAPGSGKTTLSRLLELLLTKILHKKVALLSLDDLCLPRQRREQLSREVHPLFKYAGVPGTHNVEAGEQILNKLKSENIQFPVRIPRFDKTADDVIPEQAWLNLTTPVEIILFEGWCIGCRSQNLTDLKNPINTLERYEDKKLVWREYVNKQLRGPYYKLFQKIDFLVFLEAPDFDAVYEWFRQQSVNLKINTANKQADSTMHDVDVKRNAMQYERIIRHAMQEVSERAEIKLSIDGNRKIFDVQVNA
jgi:D-glycerate 3-kinase